MRLFIICFLFVFSFSAFAQWNTNTIINTQVAISPKSQSNVHSVSDSKGGIIIAWEDNRNSLVTLNDIYAQRLNASGISKWALSGDVICNEIGVQKSPSIIDAGDGSAIITWEDTRSGNYDIYAQKIDSSGNLLWATNGVVVCNKTTNQKNPKIVGDNSGGAIIVWEDSVSFYWDVYAQRISSSGTLLWATGGVGICSAPNEQNNPKLDIDDLGGAIITWQDKRNNVDYDIYAQRVNSSGTALWAANGVVICNAINTQNNPRIEPDGSNGALIGWTDKRNALDYNIYAQRIDSSGLVQWAGNGVSVCNAINNQSALDIKYIGNTGVVLTWKDDRTSASANAIYAQLVSLTGSLILTINGIQISNALKSINPNTISDGFGGAIIAWQDSTLLGWDITTQKINSSGILQWATGGISVCNASQDQINVSQVNDGNGGAIYAWDDRRNTTDYDIYAHHLYFDGSSFVGINELSKTNSIKSFCFPNPITSNSSIKIIENNVPWEIKIFDSLGNLIQKQILNATEVYPLNLVNYNSGIYFYLITLKDKSASAKGSFISAN